MTGESYSAKELAEVMGVSKRAVIKRAHKEGWPFEAGTNRARRYLVEGLPRDMQAALKTHGAKGKAEDGSTEMTDGEFDGFDRAAQRKKDEAMRWAAIIKEFEQYARGMGRKKRCKAARDFVLKYRIEHPEEKAFSDETLFRKVQRFKRSGVQGLIPRTGATHNLKPWPEEARAWLWQAYCNINRPTASWCIGQLRAEAKKQRWRLPSAATMRRYLMRIPQETRDRWRRGEKYWREHWMPSVLRDYEQMDPAELYVADHVQINVAVRHPSGRVLFPWFTGWMDMRCRKILGWVLADIPSSNTINLSLKRTIEGYGASEHAVIDNGRDFSARHFSGGAKKRFRFKLDENEVAGIYKLLNIEPHFCIPGNPQAKSIERWFWTREMNFDVAFPTYRGNKVLNRPEGVDKRIKQDQYVPEWEELLGCLENYIENYNQEHEHQGHGMNKRSPNEVWNEYFATHAQRRVSPTSLRLLMMRSSRPVNVGRYGVRAFDQFYRGFEVMEHQGEQVVYRYDPADLASIHVYTTEWQFIGTAERVHRTAWDDEEAYHEIKKLEKKRKRALKAEREAAENLVEVEFGYRKAEPSGEHRDRSAKIVRVLRTQLDSVEVGSRQQAAGSKEELTLEKFREEFNEMTARRLEERRKKGAERPQLFTLTIPGGGD